MHAGQILIPDLIELYSRIDLVYRQFAEKVGLTCEGCDGVRCCTVDLTLHTSVEMHCLKMGYNALAPPIRAEVLRRCRTVIAAKKADPWGDEYRNAVCALNFDGKCMLYGHRPMICRLAGIPHLIVRPDGRSVESGGCSHYQTHISPHHPSERIDRTEFYRAMAQFEMATVQETGARTVPCTVAEVLGRE
jgi:hypothetical protein